MNEKIFKNIFNTITKNADFTKYGNGWYKQTNDTIILLSFQKSNFGNYLDLNIKVFIRGLFNKNYQLSKDLFKDTGDIFRRQPVEYNPIFDLDREVKEDQLKEELIDFFNKFICPYSEIMAKKSSITQFYKKIPQELFILPAVKKEMGL